MTPAEEDLLLGPITIQLVNNQGDVVEGEVELQRRDGEAMTVFVDEDGLTTLELPATTSATGELVCWVPPGPYEWRATSGGHTLDWRPVDVPGATGVEGPPGPPGPSGADSTVPGPQGPTGTKGDKGDKGDIGNTGTTGAQGPQGTVGTAGAQGPAGPGVATGGTTDQLLAKNSATDYDTKWVAPPSGGGAGHTIQDEGAALAARAALNFVGAGITASDDAANDRTNVTITRPKVVAGSVNADGTVRKGSGFTSVKNTTGDYTITFTVAFAAVPVITFGVGDSPGGLLAKVYVGIAPTTTTFRVNTFTASPTASADGSFDFIAMDAGVF